MGLTNEEGKAYKFYASHSSFSLAFYGVQSCGILFLKMSRPCSTGAWEGQKGEMSDTRAKGGKLRRVLLVRSDCFFFFFVEAQRGGEEQGKAGTRLLSSAEPAPGETWTLPRGQDIYRIEKTKSHA